MMLIEGIGRWALVSVGEMGRMLIFVLSSFAWLFRPPLRAVQIIKQVHFIGYKSTFVVVLTAGFTGMVLALQGYYTLRKFGSEGLLGSAVALSMIRELGPVLTGLLVTGRAGSATTAEIGTMVATEQLDGLRMMSVDPLDFVVAPKAQAMLLSMPLLSTLFVLFGIFGGWLVGVVVLGGDPGSYMSTLTDAVVFRDDIVGGYLKAGVFGLLVGLVATYRGYTAKPTSAGVSAAATSTVVIASVATLIVDYFITALWGY